MSDTAILLGLAIAFVGGIMFLVAAFRTSILWGLGVLFIPFISLFFLIFHWQVAKKSFFIQVFGVALLVFAVLTEQGSIRIPSMTPNNIPFLQSANASPPQKFTCDGRVHSSQMTSSEEATYFLRNCPNTKMDGDNDGIPCESQWCNDARVNSSAN